MLILKRTILCLTLTIALLLCGCNGSNSYIYNSDTDNHFINSTRFESFEIVNIAKFDEIKSGMTYQQIFDILHNEISQYYILSDGCKTYLLSNNKILSVKYENANDVCEFSGKELLNMAKSYLPPSEIVISGKQTKTDSFFAVVINEKFKCVFSADTGFSDLNLKGTQIVFQDGTAATEDDLTVNSQLIIYYNDILESDPGTVNCSEIIILNNLS